MRGGPSGCLLRHSAVFMVLEASWDLEDPKETCWPVTGDGWHVVKLDVCWNPKVCSCLVTLASYVNFPHLI